MSRKFKHQDVYAQGMGGVYDPTASMTWGPKISELPNDARYGGNTDNQYTRLYGKHEGMYYNPKRAQAGLDGWTTPQIYDNTGDFFSNGFTENANFSISQRTDRTSYAFGLNNSHQEGVVRNTGLDRWAHAARSTGTSTMSGSSDLPPTMCTPISARLRRPTRV